MRGGGQRSAVSGQSRGGLVAIAVVCLALISVLPGMAQNTDDLPVLRPIRTELPPTFWEQRGFCLGLYAVEAIAFAGLLAWLFTRPVPPRVVPIEVQVRAELEQLRRQPHDARTLTRVSQCLRRYFTAAFQLPAGEMTTAEFSRALAAKEEIGARLGDETVAFLHCCDAAKFSAAAEMNPARAVAAALDIVAQGEARREEQRQARAAAAGTT